MTVKLNKIFTSLFERCIWCPNQRWERKLGNKGSMDCTSIFLNKYINASDKDGDQFALSSKRMVAHFHISSACWCICQCWTWSAASTLEEAVAVQILQSPPKTQRKDNYYQRIDWCTSDYIQVNMTKKAIDYLYGHKIEITSTV